MRRCLEWAEGHWEAVGLVVSMVCALIVAVTLAVAFNVISTLFDGLQHDAADVVPQTRSERSEIRDSSGSGAVI